MIAQAGLTRRFLLTYVSRPLIRQGAMSTKTRRRRIYLCPLRTSRTCRESFCLLIFVCPTMLRPSLTTIPFHSQQKSSRPSATSTPIKPRTRVAFDANGRLSVQSTDLIALSLAEKHETRPSTRKMSSFAETIEVGSASSWNKVTLTKFGAKFKRDEITPLNTVITDPKFYDENNENSEFASRTSSSL